MAKDQVSQVVAGWIQLSSEERATVMRTIRRYEDGSDTERAGIRKTFIPSVTTGPSGGRCPCCGR